MGFQFYFNESCNPNLKSHLCLLSLQVIFSRFTLDHPSMFPLEDHAGDVELGMTLNRQHTGDMLDNIPQEHFTKQNCKMNKQNKKHLNC